MKKNWLVLSLATALIVCLAGGCLWMFLRFRFVEKQLADAQSEMEELREVKMRSIVMRSISDQMGKIADAEKQNALLQADMAEQNAQEARDALNEAQRQSRIANEARREAEEKSKEAERQHLLADEQREVAIQQKTAALAAEKETKKLRLLELGFSLANIAITQEQVGNVKLAQRLAYAAWNFTSQNGGALTTPLQALISTAHGVDTLLNLRGGITAIDQQANRIVCASKYGEVYLFTPGKEGVYLCRDSHYDFREVRLTPDGNVLARDLKEGWLNVTKYPLRPAVSTPTPREEDLLLAREATEEEITTLNSKGELVTLLGMRSRVTGLARYKETRMATSLDGTLRIWDLDSDLHMPTTLFACDKWIYCMHYDSQRVVVFLGTSDGKLIRVCVDPTLLAKRIANPLSQSEWHEFVGSDIPYNTYK